MAKLETVTVYAAQRKIIGGKLRSAALKIVLPRTWYLRTRDLGAYHLTREAAQKLVDENNVLLSPSP